MSNTQGLFDQIIDEWKAKEDNLENHKSIVLGLLDLLRDSTDLITQARYKTRVRHLKEQLPYLKEWEI